MLRLFLTFVSVCIISSTNAFADKIQGKFFCKEVFPDGSYQEVIVTVTGSKMTMQDIEISSLFSEYTEIYVTTNQEKGFSVFAIENNSSQNIYFLAPTYDYNVLMLTAFDSEKFYTKSQIRHGTCRRL